MDPSYPLADGPPPRYAVESDDEDEHNPSPKPNSIEPPEVNVEFRSIYDIPSKKPLVFASGEAGLTWAKLINLGEQRAGIYVNHLPVGLLFLPFWTHAIVVVSETETRTRLPLFAMTTYATAIIERLQPTSVGILDSYLTRAYISPRAISQDSAPIRYLSVGEKPVPDSELELFAPPNLLQSTTASLLNELFLRSIDQDPARDATAQATVLLPSAKVPPPAPTTFDGKGVAGDFPDASWDMETLEKAHRWLFAIIEEGVDQSSFLAQSAVRRPVTVGKTRAALGEVGEGAMYI